MTWILTFKFQFHWVLVNGEINTPIRENRNLPKSAQIGHPKSGRKNTQTTQKVLQPKHKIKKKKKNEAQT